ncbi:hypothetical protein [Candidatus Cyanaurora vandensis]|uniref:hypothetical protein n=1 Tax=Candidatus Cyanaurora vandensis TaxID=2714958 RepID=UPI00257F5570|nr:hypothetical protein [Candidatus Cyanaurora vandensis]
MKTLGAFVRRDFLEQNRYGPFWIGRLGSLFLQVFSTFFTAQLFNGNPALTPYGGNYFAYALVGTLTLQLLVVTMAALPGAVYYAQTQGTLEPLLTSPTPIGAILVAASSFGILTELVGMVLFAGVAWVVDPGVFAQVHWGALGFLLAVHGLCGWGWD